MRDWPPHPSPRYRRAVFLDRDGTINVDTHYPHLVEDLAFVCQAIDGMKLLATLPLDIIVVSNQSGIALEIFSIRDMKSFNHDLRLSVERAGGRIDAFYYCPHLEPRQISAKNSACKCSKPSPGMLLEAARDFGLSLAESYLIGDKTSDIAAGAGVGCETILVATGKAGKEEGAIEIKPTYSSENLHQAARIIRSRVEG